MAATICQCADARKALSGETIKYSFEFLSFPFDRATDNPHAPVRDCSTLSCDIDHKSITSSASPLPLFTITSRKSLTSRAVTMLLSFMFTLRPPYICQQAIQIDSSRPAHPEPAPPNRLRNPTVRYEWITIGPSPRSPGSSWRQPCSTSGKCFALRVCHVAIVANRIRNSSRQMIQVQTDSAALSRQAAHIVGFA